MQVSDASVTQMPEYLQRVQVLKNTGFIDDEKVVQMKGRIMCELNSSGALWPNLAEILYGCPLDAKSDY
jgi:antiviral helicase SKI2